jgi:hypothetical protein
MSNTPNKPEPNSSDKPDANSSDKPDSSSSDTPDSNSSKSGSNFFNLLNYIFPNFPISNLINSTSIAQWLNNNPVLANFLIFLLLLLSTGNLYQFFINNRIFDLAFQGKVCQDNQKLIDKDLKIQGKSGNITSSPKPATDSKNIELLPFFCEYSIEENNNLSTRKVYLRHTPVFEEYLDQDYKKNPGKEMDMNEVCQHPIMLKQMKQHAKNNFLFDEKKGDTIKPGKAEILAKKSYAYPVHRWVCQYSFSKQEKGKATGPLIGANNPAIDLDLVPYCEQKATDENNNFKVPHYWDYDNPYSFYCTAPYSLPDS